MTGEGKLPSAAFLGKAVPWRRAGETGSRGAANCDPGAQPFRPCLQTQPRMWSPASSERSCSCRRPPLACGSLSLRRGRRGRTRRSCPQAGLNTFETMTEAFLVQTCVTIPKRETQGGRGTRGPFPGPSGPHAELYRLWPEKFVRSWASVASPARCSLPGLRKLPEVSKSTSSKQCCL